MMPFPAALVAAGGASFYVGSQGRASGATSTLTSLGAQAGDFALIIGINDNGAPTAVTSGSGDTWPRMYGGTAVIFQKELTTADLSAGVSLNATTPYIIHIVRGAHSASVRASQSSSDPTSTVPGVTKGADHAGWVFVTMGNTGAGTVDGPATITTRQTQSGTITAGSYTVRVADRLVPANPLYVDGTGFVWTTANAGVGSQTRIAVIELLSSGGTSAPIGGDGGGTYAPSLDFSDDRNGTYPHVYF